MYRALKIYRHNGRVINQNRTKVYNGPINRYTGRKRIPNESLTMNKILQLTIRNWPNSNPYNGGSVVQVIKPQCKTRVYETCYILARTSWKQKATDFLFTPDKLSHGLSLWDPLYLIELRLNSPEQQLPLSSLISTMYNWILVIFRTRKVKR